MKSLPYKKISSSPSCLLAILPSAM
jgi:hypothetical protein